MFHFEHHCLQRRYAFIFAFPSSVLCPSSSTICRPSSASRHRSSVSTVCHLQARAYPYAVTVVHHHLLRVARLMMQASSFSLVVVLVVFFICVFAVAITVDLRIFSPTLRHSSPDTLIPSPLFHSPRLLCPGHTSHVSSTECIPAVMTMALPFH